MKISNAKIVSTDLTNNTVKISFTISEATENVNIYLKINNEEYKVIFLNKANGNLEYTTKVSRGVNNLLLKATDSTTEYISEPIQVLLKEAPSIKNLECSYSDSTGKYILNFAFNGDTNFKYNIYLKLDANDYIEVLSNQISGDKTIEQTSTMGNHTCILKVSDGYDDYTFSSFQFKITNRKPILSKVLVTDITNNGEAYIHYSTKDIESSTLTHKLVIGTTQKVITPTRVNNFYSYKITGLSKGTSNCKISISDGIDTISSDVFSIEVFSDTTDKKELLRRAKVRYDSAYQQLRDIIVSVISDLKYDYDIENALIAKAQDNYKIEYSNFNKISQQSIDTIGSNKVKVTKQELQSEINDVDSAVNSLESTMWGVFQDGILDQSERDTLSGSLDLVAKEKIDIDKDYEALYNNEDLLDPSKTKLQTNYNNFITAHNSLVATINNIINKEGIIENTDKTNIDTAFENWRTALGNYRTASLEAIDSIAKKKADDSADVVDKKWAEIVLDPETGIKSQVGSLQSKITGAGGIEERLETAESKITEDAITNTVKKNFYTKTETEGAITSKGYQTASQVKQTADLIRSEVSSVRTEINNLQIGGRNLVLNSDVLNSKFTVTGEYKGTRTVVEDTEAKSKKHLEFKCITAGSGFHNPIFSKSSDKIGKTYTWSFWAKCSVAKSGTVGHECGGQRTINLTTEWQKFTKTWVFTDANNSSFTWYLNWKVGEILYVRDFKIEEGNKATDWSPAPEDVQNQIDENKNEVNTRMSVVEQTIDSWGVKITENETEIASLKLTDEQFEVKMSQNINDIASLSVSLDNIESSIVSESGVKSIIRQSSNDIQIGFNGINDRININPTSMDFRATNNNRDMSLYGGQVCIYNNTNDTFMSTMGSVLKTSNSDYKGVGFLLGKNANIFTIGRDDTWTDITTNRSPNPIHYVTFNFKTNQANIDMVLNTNNINMQNNNLIGAAKIGCSELQTNNILNVSNSKVLSCDSTDITLYKTINANSNRIYNLDSLGANKVQTNNWYNLSDSPLFTYNSTWGHIDLRLDMECNSYTLKNPVLSNATSSTALASGYNIDVENDINVLFACEDITVIDENGNVFYDINQAILLLYGKIHDLEKEIESLKNK